jgi:hypothetical protein
MGRLINFNGWIDEEGEASLPEFYEMNADEKNAYISSIVDKPEEMRSNIQKHIVRFFYKGPTEKQKHFFTLDDE